ncbi:peptidase [bacterium]|nr:peptidase [bacterium]
MKYFVFVIMIAIMGCQKPKETVMEKSELQKKIDAYAKIEINVKMDHLSPKEKELVKTLVKAGEIADEIFWKQTSYDAIATRESLKGKTDKASNEVLEYVMINYGPYDREDNKRFTGEGAQTRPDGAAFYPADMTKEEFEKFVKAHPKEEKELTGLYTVVERENGKLKAVPYHQVYKAELEKMSALLQQASELSENESLKKYLSARARAILTDDYYESDVLWMKLKDNHVDVVIGPIENYEDNMFNYKAAYEAAVMIKDPEGTKELQIFQSHLDALEQNLPQKKEYIRASAGKANVLEVVNIAYFGGDFQKGVKTIAASLPNDPKVHDEYGGKKQMYKNLMEAKFDKIVKPIGEKIVAEEFRKYIDPHSFTTFVTMHEVSHTLGRSYVYGNDKLDVRKALKDLYSAIEEAKADVLGIYNMDYFKRQGLYDDEAMKRHYVTYLVGLFRSIRFGAEEAHGKANIAQMIFLKEQGAVARDANGYWTINFDKFQSGVAALGKVLLEIEAEGNYDGAKNFLETYGKLTDDIKADLAKLTEIPRDLNTTYGVMKTLQ